MNSPVQKQPPNNDCFSENLLHDFMQGKLDDELAEKIVNHLEVCTNCEDTVVAIEDKEDTFVSKLPKKSPVSFRNPELEGAIENIKIREFEPESETNTFDQQFIGDYQIKATLGIGGMGTVFRATHSHLQKEVALKVLPHRKMQNPEAISRFRREMKIIGRLDHPAIVKATDAGQDQGTHYLAMEFVDGFDLSQLIKLVGKLGTDSSCEIIRQAAIGIHYVHSQGVIHRDIKPSNLMLTPDGNVKILDLGLAMLSSVHGMVDELTTVGQLMGTLDYMAPEQYGDCHNIDLRADIYALGATLYKLLTGSAPYELTEDESPLQKLKRIATEAPTPILEKLPSLNPQLAAIIDQSVSRDQAQRYTSAVEFAEALAPFAKAESLPDIFENAKELSDQLIERENQLAAIQQKIQVPTVSDPSQDSKPLTQAASDRHNGSINGRSKWWLRSAVLSLFVAAAFCLGIIIQIELDKGRLVIESDSDNVKVTLLKDGKVYDKMELEQGTNSTRIRAGKYEVLIDSESDKLVLDNNQFKLIRGETVVAKITRTEKPISSLPPTTNNETSNTLASEQGPVYNGLNLEQWLEKVIEDTLDPSQISSLSISETTLSAIRRLSKNGDPKKLNEAAQFWARIIANETSLQQINKLVPLANILANNRQNAEILAKSFVEAIHQCLDSAEVRVKVNSGERSYHKSASTIFLKWSPEALRLIELYIFDPKYDKAPNSEYVRIEFLKSIDFRTGGTSFSASRDNILHLLETYDRASQENRGDLEKMLDSLLSNPTQLSSRVRSELVSRFKITSSQSNPSRFLALRSLIRLGEITSETMLAIVEHIERQPELIELLSEFDDLSLPLAKIKSLLNDPDWGWTTEFRNPPLTPELSRRRTTVRSFMGGSSGGGGSSSGMISGSSMTAEQMAELMKRMGRRPSSSRTEAPEKISSKRHQLVVQLAKLKEKGKSLVGTLKFQQRLSSNQEYLEAVWNSVSQISEKDVLPTYAGKDLSEWKKILNEVNSKRDLAIAMIANGQLIGGTDFDDRYFGQSSNRSRSTTSRRKLSVKNRTEYRRFVQTCCHEFDILILNLSKRQRKSTKPAMTIPAWRHTFSAKTIDQT